ncbi:MAG: gfo/Idh/MocA family oxidoreductase [Verrucomicrobiaceae bacterium]|nr:MAG: gfo/Idh/MocA family oxidoreductase [Verrucomicrobiaceae bacterium]
MKRIPHHCETGLSRRTFLRNTIGFVGALGFPTIIPSSALGLDGKVPPSERIRIGVIGCGSQSRAASNYLPGGLAEIVALADPDRSATRKWAETILKGAKVREYSDFRELLQSDVDAVNIATGDYWHVPIALLSARAGKHLYVEKPLGLSIEQCLACREISAEHKVVFQYGTQNRSKVYVRSGIELLLNGHIGEIKEIYVFAPQGESGGSPLPVLPVPDGFDYNMWLGPAPEAPFSQDRVLTKGKRNGIFHIYDYAIGFVAGWGAHAYDQLQWWLDEMNFGMPESVEATGTIPTEGLFNTVTHWDATITYPCLPKVRFADFETIIKHLPKFDGINLLGHGTVFVGSEGWLYFHRNGFQASSREILEKSKDPGPRRVVNAGVSQQANFLDAILGKNKVVSPLDSAIRSDICCHLTNLAIRTGKPVGWDAKKNTITGNSEAVPLMRRAMREPWNVLNPKYTG